MGSAKTDQVARQKIRQKLRRWGMDPEELELCMIQIRERQIQKNLGHLALDAPLCTRASYVRLMRKQITTNDKSPAHFRLGEDYIPPSDTGYKPTQIDPLLQGTARATGVTAKAVRKRKTLTKFEHDQVIGEN